MTAATATATAAPPAPNVPTPCAAENADADADAGPVAVLPRLAERAAGAPRSGTFDVCHPGVVLRALLLAHALLAVGLLFAVHDAASWLALLGAGSASVLPAVLLWLLMACGLKRPLARTPRAGQAVAAAALGALAGVGGFALSQLGGPVDPPGGPYGNAAALWQPFACAAAGAAAGLAMFQWLDLRARAQLPADTTARLAELQSRIRPHFLFNTLNTALGLVRLDPARAEGVLEDLAELFRAALADDDGRVDPARGDGSVSLADEVELAKRYLAIEQIRFGERLRVGWDLDAAANAARVPPLLLQPLVENAVRHGVEPADEGGTLHVQTRVTLGRTVLTIVNSVPPAGAASSTPGHGIALRNVRERLRLMHDVAAQLEVRRHAGEFHVRIVLPL